MDRPPRKGGRYVADLIGPFAGSGPLYRQVADALKAAIDRRELAAGTVLPPERTLAAALAVGRSTVVAAYDGLKPEGYWLLAGPGAAIRALDAGWSVDDHIRWVVDSATGLMAPDDTR